MKLSTINKLIKLNKDLYESQASQWAKTRTDLWEQPIVDIVRSIPSHSSVLDLGCGNARLYQILRQINIDYLGIDPSKKLIQIDKTNYPDAKFKIGDALKLGYKNKFDYIVSIAVLQHIPSVKLQSKFLNNCYNSLKKNGKLVLTVWNRHQLRYEKYFLASKLYSDMQKNDLLVPWKDSGYSRYIHAFTTSELANLAKNVGFKDIKCYYIGKNTTSDKQNGLNILLTASKK